MGPVSTSQRLVSVNHKLISVRWKHIHQILVTTSQKLVNAQIKVYESVETSCCASNIATCQTSYCESETS